LNAWDVFSILPGTTPPGEPFVDSNGDNDLAPDDALEIINYLNSLGPELEEEPPSSETAVLEASSDIQSRVSPQLADDDLYALIAAEPATYLKRRPS
jgi:hypothetical protein